MKHRRANGPMRYRELILTVGAGMKATTADETSSVGNSKSLDDGMEFFISASSTQEVRGE